MSEYPSSRSRRPRYRRRVSHLRQSTGALTAKLVLVAVVGTLIIGFLIAVQMAAGRDPALAPKVAARAKQSSTRSSSNSSSSSSVGSGTDPYSQSYGGDDYYYGGSDGYSGSGGYSSGSGGYSYSPPPVTSSTS